MKKILKEWQDGDVSICIAKEESPIDDWQIENMKLWYNFFEEQFKSSIDEMPNVSEEQLNEGKETFYEYIRELKRTKTIIEYFTGCQFLENPLIEKSIKNIVHFIPATLGVHQVKIGKNNEVCFVFKSAQYVFAKSNEKEILKKLCKEALNYKIMIEVASKYELDFIMAETFDEKMEIINQYYSDLTHNYGILTGIPININSFDAINDDFNFSNRDEQDDTDYGSLN